MRGTPLPVTVIVVALEAVEHGLKFTRCLELDGFARQRPVDGAADDDSKVDWR